MLSHPLDGIILTEHSGEVHRKSWWEMDLNAPTGSMPTDCQYRIRQMPSPSDCTNVVTYVAINSEWLYPGIKKAAGNVDIKLHLYAKDALYEFFRSWLKLVYDPETEEVGLYSDVVGSGSLKLYVPAEKGLIKLDRTIDLIDVWPSGMSLGELDRDSDGEPLGYTVTLQVMDVRDGR